MGEISGIQEVNIESPSILIVNDSSSEQQNLVTLTEQWGYIPIVLDKGQDALKMIGQSSIQLVLIDWKNNSLGEKKFCEEVRQFKLSRYVYIILMLPQNDHDDLVIALEEGADEVLVKPIEPAELEARLHSAERRIQLQEFLSYKNENLKKAYDAFENDLRTVYSIQRSYLPSHKNVYKDIFLEWFSIPSRYVSGDHLDVFQIQPGVYGFYLFDVSGHGVSAAIKAMQLAQLLSNRNKNSLIFDQQASTKSSLKLAKPSEVVVALNELYQQTENDWSYFTLIYGIYDLTNNKVTFCQAGHPSPFVLSSNLSIKECGVGGPPVGLFENIEFEDQTLILEQDDLFLMFSDGITEAFSPSGELYGSERLASTIQKGIQKVTPWQLSSYLYNSIEKWVGSQTHSLGFEDDLSFLMLAHQKGFIKNDQTSKQLSDAETFEQKSVNTSLFTYAQLKQKPKKEKISVLIVDDSGSYLAILSSMLKAWGYHVISASDGVKAIEQYQEHTPDFVLTDWNMPEMSGIVLCEKLRKIESTNYCYIILITGYASRDDLLKSLHVGADDFLIKPVNPSELKARLNTAKRISALHQDLSFKNDQLMRLHESMCQDVEEVARIQHSLLPIKRQACWPVAIDSALIPAFDVAGKQIVLLEETTSQVLFMMISLPDKGTSAALKVMSLSRYLSMDEGIELLFPLNDTGSRARRFVACATDVVSQLNKILPHSEKQGFYSNFDLLYGVLQLDEGSLIVSAIGEWQMVISPQGYAEHLIVSTDPELNSERCPNGRYLTQISQHAISPGTQLFFMPKECAIQTDLGSLTDWKKCMRRAYQTDLSLDSKLRLFKQRVAKTGPKDNPANKLFSQIDNNLFENQQTPQEASFPDFLLLALQWQEYSEVQFVAVDKHEVEANKQYIQSLANAEFDDCHVLPKVPIELGQFKHFSKMTGLVNMHSLEQICNYARTIVESLNFGEMASYNVDLVLSEALVNIMKHGFCGTKPRDSAVTFVAFEYYLGIMIYDQGLAIPVSLFESARPDMSFVDQLSLKELPESGMGLTFLTMSSSCLRYSSTPSSNKLVMLISGQNKVSELSSMSTD